jgi:hypothetical protein
MLSEQTKHARAARPAVSPQQQWIFRGLSARLKEPVEDVFHCAVGLYRDVAYKGLTVVQLCDICSARQSLPVYLIVQSLSSTRSQRATRQLTLHQMCLRCVLPRQTVLYQWDH